MMMASKDPKKLAMLIVSKKDGSSVPQETKPKTDYDAALESGASRLMSALDAKDAKGFAQAFKTLMDLCNESEGKEEPGQEGY